MVMTTTGAATMIAAITAKVMMTTIMVADKVGGTVAAKVAGTVTAATQVRTEQNWNQKASSVQYPLQLTPPHLS